MGEDVPKILQGEDWTKGLNEHWQESSDDLKIPPFSWGQGQIYKWLLKICSKHRIQFTASLITRLTPFIDNFPSGDFGGLDPDLSGIITLEHRRLFDNTCFSPRCSSVDDSVDDHESLSPSPRLCPTQDSPLDRRSTPASLTGMTYYEHYPPKSPDSGIPSSPPFIEQPPSSEVYPNHISPSAQPLPHPSDIGSHWPQHGAIASVIPWPQHDQIFQPYPLLPPEYQYSPHFYPSMHQSQLIDLPVPCSIPPPLPQETKPQRTTKSKRNKKSKGQGRNVTDKVVDTRILETMPSSVQLWEFVLRVLRNPLYSGIISWENQHDGVFHIHDPQALADLWGRHRNHEGMNYDKMSRAMRYYYRRGILEPVRERLTYKFSSRLRQMFFD